ncbi:LOW QUALITY PROTEIN: hypothetical protein V1478_006459 [Vespula squamosa]|uniref:Uncharacterized protein n=1 Tax=Vespula squamosa TaxID=30214 RepID=A0ABD2B7Z2_VESSQ
MDGVGDASLIRTSTVVVVTNNKNIMKQEVYSSTNYNSKKYSVTISSYQNSYLHYVNKQGLSSRKVLCCDSKLMAAAGKASEAREGGSLKRRELPSNGVAPFVGRILLYTIKAAFRSFDFATRHIWLNDDKLISCGLGPARKINFLLNEETIQVLNISKIFLLTSTGLVQDCSSIKKGRRSDRTSWIMTPERNFKVIELNSKQPLGSRASRGRSRKELSVSRTAPLSLWKDRGWKLNVEIRLLFVNGMIRRTYVKAKTETGFENAAEREKWVYKPRNPCTTAHLELEEIGLMKS